jgi:hypothetical protein
MSFLRQDETSVPKRVSLYLQDPAINGWTSLSNGDTPCALSVLYCPASSGLTVRYGG